MTKTSATRSSINDFDDTIINVLGCSKGLNDASTFPVSQDLILSSLKKKKKLKKKTKKTKTETKQEKKLELMSLHLLVLEIFLSFDRLVNSVPVKTMLLDTNSALQTEMKKKGIIQ